MYAKTTQRLFKIYVRWEVASRGSENCVFLQWCHFWMAPQLECFLFGCSYTKFALICQYFITNYKFHELFNFLHSWRALECIGVVLLSNVCAIACASELIENETFSDPSINPLCLLRQRCVIMPSSLLVITVVNALING